MCAGFGGGWREGDEFQNGNWRVYPGTPKGGAPLFFVSVASKWLSQSVSLLFATLAGRSISVAAKGLKAIVGCNLRTVASEEKNKKSELERDEPFEARGKRARVGCDSFRQGWNLRSRLSENKHEEE